MFGVDLRHHLACTTLHQRCQVRANISKYDHRRTEHACQGEVLFNAHAVRWRASVCAEKGAGRYLVQQGKRHTPAFHRGVSYNLATQATLGELLQGLTDKRDATRCSSRKRKYSSVVAAVVVVVVVRERERE